VVSDRLRGAIGGLGAVGARLEKFEKMKGARDIAEEICKREFKLKVVRRLQRKGGEGAKRHRRMVHAQKTRKSREEGRPGQGIREGACQHRVAPILSRGLAQPLLGSGLLILLRYCFIIQAPICHCHWVWPNYDRFWRCTATPRPNLTKIIKT